MYKEKLAIKISEVVEEIRNKFPSQRQIILSDFDECIVRDSISRLNTEFFLEKYQMNKDVLSSDQGDTREYMQTLSELLIGIPTSEVRGNLKRLIDEVPLNKNADVLLERCQGNRVPIVFVTCGLEWSVEEFNKKYNLPNVFCIGCSFLKNNGFVSKTSLCIGMKEKGIIARKIESVFREKIIITVGHSASDRFLVEGGTLGYRFNLDGEGSLGKFGKMYDITSRGLDWQPVVESVQEFR